MLRWFHALMPKEERFFELFARHSDAVLAGAQALRAMMEGGEAISANCKTVMDREHDADNATREVLIAVRRTFITPFDRGSIRDLITAIRTWLHAPVLLMEVDDDWLRRVGTPGQPGIRPAAFSEQ